MASDKYEVIFKRTSPTESTGEVKNVRFGDIVGYVCRDGSRTGRVIKVRPRVKEVRTAKSIWGEHTLHRGDWVAFDHITEVLRPKVPIKAEPEQADEEDDDITAGHSVEAPDPPREGS